MPVAVLHVCGPTLPLAPVEAEEDTYVAAPRARHVVRLVGTVTSTTTTTITCTASRKKTKPKSGAAQGHTPGGHCSHWVHACLSNAGACSACVRACLLTLTKGRSPLVVLTCGAHCHCRAPTPLQCAVEVQRCKARRAAHAMHEPLAHPHLTPYDKGPHAGSLTCIPRSSVARCRGPAAPRR